MNEKKATSPNNVLDFRVRASMTPPVLVTLPEPKDSPTRRLSTVERATLRISAPSVEDVRVGQGILHEAAFRIALYQQRGLLPHASGHYVAQQLQSVFWPALGNGYRLAKRGYVLLAALDEAELGVEVWLSAEPLPGDPRNRYRQMRLHERIRELGTTKRR